MSSYIKLTKRPYGDKSWDLAAWLDDYFGSHEYGVKFTDGVILRSSEHKLETINDIMSEYLNKVGMDKFFFN